MKKQENRILELAKATKEGWGTEADKPLVFDDCFRADNFIKGLSYYAKLNMLPDSDSCIEETIVFYISKVNNKTIEYSIVYDGITEYNTHKPNAKHYYVLTKVKDAVTYKSKLVYAAELNNRCAPGESKAFIDKLTGVVVTPIRAYVCSPWLD